VKQRQIGGGSAGMRRPNGTTPNLWRFGGECAGQTEQHQIGGVTAGNAPAKWTNTKSVVARRGMHPFAKNGQWWCGEGMRQPNGATPNRWDGGECAGKRRDQIGGECVGQVKQRQIGGGSAGNAPAKWTNTKSVVARRGMRRPNGTTPNLWRFGGECAGQTEQHQIGGGSVGNAPAKWTNIKSVDRQRMSRQTNRLQ
jgi:hypothetical protein